MAAQIVSSIITQLGSLLAEDLTRRGMLVVGAEKDVKKLASTLSAIEVMLLDAEVKQLTNKDAEVWVTKLKNVCYKIDDVLDEWTTEILKHRLANEEYGKGWLKLKLLKISNLLKRVWLSDYYFSPHDVCFRCGIASRIKELYEDLENLNKDTNMLGFRPKPTPSYKSLQTSSVIKSWDVKGREEETELLKGKLLRISEVVQSISIQGAGGLGKTTLAKLLYNDDVVGGHFDKRIWVCVSNTFDPTTVAKTILESLTGSAQQSNTLSILLEKISEMTNGMRFLLVLDDVWEDSQREWEELRSALTCNSPGSKILMTTRKGEVSRALGCIEDDVLLIRKVPEDVCRAIFTQVAFYGWNAEEKECVEGFCKDVVAKCAGSPLAAKVLGGVMQSKKSKSEWINVLKSEMWHLDQVKKQVFGPLALSSYDLSPDLRQCFQFCVVFPKDYLMDKDQLIKLWISQGFVGASGTQEVEDIGEQYFQILTARSFFQDIQTKKLFQGMEKTNFKMHDLVHDFALMLSKGESVIRTSKDMKDIATNGSVVRNLSICDYIFKDDCSIKGSLFSSMKDLRCFMTSDVDNIEPKVWDNLRGIRSFVLIDSMLNKIPSTINQLIHLRHLDLTDNVELEELPKEICELYNLWTLIINWCDNLKRLPLGMGDKLVNLKHLENELVPAPLPKSIGRLTRLKTLTKFSIHKDQAKGVVSIADLKDMNQLQGSLHVVGLSYNVAGSYEVEQADFANKTELTSLHLQFREVGEDSTDNKDEELLEAVRPSTNLKQLYIKRYMGSVYPSWMVSLSNLTHLEFKVCKEVKYLPHLGGLPSLEKLSFTRLNKVKKVGVELLLGHEQQQYEEDIGAFPKLTVLAFEFMDGWEEWDDRMLSSPSVMPRLSSLTLIDCQELKKLPDAILQKPTLKRLQVTSCNSEPPEIVLSKVWDNISHIPTIIIDDFNVRTGNTIYPF